jgi:hypothetical protein
MTTYFWHGISYDPSAGWTLAPGLPNLPNQAGEGIPGGASDTDIILPGSVANVITEGTTLGTLLLAPGAVGIFGDASQQLTGDFQCGTVILQPGSALNLDVYSQLGQVVIQQGATLEYGPAQKWGVGLDGGTITDLYNQGGTLGFLDPDLLQLGGPGFVQTGGFEPHESFYGDGPVHVLDLGTITHGTPEPFIPLGVTSGDDTLAELVNDPGLPIGAPFFNYIPALPDSPPLGVGVNTNLLGAHTSILGAFQQTRQGGAPPGPITNWLVVKDTVV